MCRTGDLGGFVSECKTCKTIINRFSSCGNRHCPCCQGLKSEIWTEKYRQYTIDVPYYHIIFTMPAELRGLAYANKKLFYSSLLSCSAEAMMEMRSNPKYLGARLGFTSSLHTWGSQLNYHPHVHSIVVGGGMTSDMKFKRCSHDNFMLPVKALGVLFRGKFLDKIQIEYKKGNLTIPQGEENFEKLITKMYRLPWMPHICPTDSKGNNVLKYLSRYINRIAISNSRIKCVDTVKKTVTFIYKDYRKDKQILTATLDAVEFLRRFSIHILPKRFMKTRHYGFLSNPVREKYLCIIHDQMKTERYVSPYKDLTLIEILKLKGIDLNRCHNCGGTEFTYHKKRPQGNDATLELQYEGIYLDSWLGDDYYLIPDPEYTEPIIEVTEYPKRE